MPVFTQWLDKYLDQKYAGNFLYQILLALAMNLMGFGLAGLARRFLVYPAFCIWPKSLVTIALNKALHSRQYMEKKICDEIPGYVILNTFSF